MWWCVKEGLKEYILDLWNLADWFTNFCFINWIVLRWITLSAYFWSGCGSFLATL